MANPRNLSVHPAQGRQLPHDWQRQATARAKAADDAYMARMEEAWRQPIGYSTETLARMGCISLTKNALLPQQKADRADSRFDSELRLIGRTDDGYEVWSDGHGTTIRRRRK